MVPVFETGRDGEYLARSSFGWKQSWNYALVVGFQIWLCRFCGVSRGDLRASLREEEKLSEELGAHPLPTLQPEAVCESAPKTPCVH